MGARNSSVFAEGGVVQSSCIRTGLPAACIETELWLLVVTGRAGPILGAGGILREGLDPIDQALDGSDWDGSDMFVPANRNVILLTDGAARRLKSARLRNVLFEPAGLTPAPPRGVFP